MTCSPHSSPPLRFCEQGLTSPHSPQGRRGVCREKQLGTRVGDQLPQWCARPRVSESRSGSGRVETQCLHVGPQCKLVVVHAFRELGGVRLQASKHGLPPTPVGGPENTNIFQTSYSQNVCGKFVYPKIRWLRGFAFRLKIVFVFFLISFMTEIT